jgi:hypothetical protein
MVHYTMVTNQYITEQYSITKWQSYKMVHSHKTVHYTMVQRHQMAELQKRYIAIKQYITEWYSITKRHSYKTVQLQNSTVTKRYITEQYTVGLSVYCTLRCRLCIIHWYFVFMKNVFCHYLCKCVQLWNTSVVHQTCLCLQDRHYGMLHNISVSPSSIPPAGCVFPCSALFAHPEPITFTPLLKKLTH